MKKLWIISLVLSILLASFAAPVLAQSVHKDLNGCQVDPNGTTYTVDVGTIFGLPFPLVEELGACCIRGYYEDPVTNGFPGGCCKHPWLVPGPPPTENQFPYSTLIGPYNPHPGDRDNPTDPPQVGYGCQCGTVHVQ